MLWACGLLVAAGAGPVAAACSVTARRTVPVEMAGGLMVVSVAVNGVASPFVLDTGAERSVIGTQAALALHVARDEWVSTDMLGLGGRDRQRLGRPASLSLDGIALRRNTMAADNTVVIGAIPTQVAGHPIAGLLGQDFLSPFDLDLDPAHGRVTLYDVSGCAGDFLPWREPYTGVQATRLVRNLLAVPVEVNGLPLRATVDTGSQMSVVTAPGAQRLGLPPGGDVRVAGFGPGIETGRLERLNIRFGGATSAAMALLVTQAHLMRSIEMVLGQDWLSHRHVWISWSTGQVLVAMAPIESPSP